MYKFKFSIVMIISVLFCASMNTLNLYGAAHSNFDSAGVVPMFRCAAGHGKLEYVLYTPVEAREIKKMDVASWDRLLFSDISAKVKHNEDAVHAAARAFFDKQTQYDSIDSLVEALRLHGKSMDMGNGHVTYFFPIQDRYLKTLTRYKVQAAIDDSAMIGLWEDIFDAITFAKRSMAQAEGRGVKVHDHDGCLWTLYDKFVLGLVKNEQRLHSMRLGVFGGRR